MGAHEGLGVLKGRVRKFVFEGSSDASNVKRETTEEMVTTMQHVLKVPQTGWNQILPQRESILFRELPPGSFAYFNHSYYCDATPDDTLATTDYGVEYSSIVGQGKVYGIQFHPEKSQAVGLRLLRNFVELG
jgi:glutamine amidotransferase